MDSRRLQKQAVGPAEPAETGLILHYARTHPAKAGSPREGRRVVSEPWLSAEDIATHLGVTKDTVYAWIADKAMPAHKVGRLWKFQTSEVDEWVRRGGAATSDEPSNIG